MRQGMAKRPVRGWKSWGITGFSYGENIAFGQRSEREVMQGWLSSPGHCKNIMSKTFKEMGVSRVGDYWTQVFATK
jgi:uncharacterized protein YkwD